MSFSFHTLGGRVLGIVLLAIGVTLAACMAVIYERTESLVTAGLEEKMRAMLVQAESTTDSMGLLVEAQAFDYPRLLQELQAKGLSNYRDTTFYQTVPVVASWAAIRQSIEGTPIQFRIVRDQPRNPSNAPANAFERDLLDKVQKGGASSVFVIDEKLGLAAYARPVRMSQSCMVCHGDPATSRTGNGKDVLGFSMEGWKPGEARGAYILTVPVSEINGPVRDGVARAVMWALPAAVLILVLSAAFVVRINRRLNATTASLEASSAELTDMSQQVSNTGVELAEGASEQAATLEETSASLEELSAVTKANADAASGAKAISQEALGSAQSGLAHMQRMQHAMVEIQQASDRVSRIIRTIDEIAFQTNILALNAAAEAARAGEAGLGFAVVADEVRSLARRSTDAARETASIIEESLARAREGSDICADVQVQLDNIGEQIERLDDTVRKISQASFEQSQGIDMINVAVSQFSEVTQANAANAESSANSSAMLRRQAHDLHSMVSALRSMVSG